MATVHLARMEGTAGFEKLVAVKTIHPHLASDRQFVDMFLDEARIASEVSHPNVCTVFDFGETDGTYYMAMELVVGESLHHAIEAVLELQDETMLRVFPVYAARILADASEGLHAAHEQAGPQGTNLGIVHRDVSPQNLIVTYEGAVKVTDFGCAKAIQRVSQTSTGMLKGKVGYAAPEQMRVGDVDRRADVWALGVCLWECLTYERLFRREAEVQTALAVLQDPIPYAAEGRSWVPRELADVAARALSRDPEQRYPTAREMGRDLRRFLTRSGYSVESAEIAEVMSTVFPRGRERYRELIHEARSLAERDTPVDVRASTGPAPMSQGSSPPRPSASGPLRLRREDALGPVSRRGSGSRWPLAALLVVLLVAGGGVYALQRGWLGLPGEAGASSPGASSDPATAGPSPRVVGVPATDEASTAEPEAVPEAAAPPEPEAIAQRDRSPPPTTTVRVARRRAAPEASGSRAERRARDTEPEREPDLAPAAEPPATEEPATPRPGTVHVIAEGGWSMVVYEGREIGRTPLSVDLPAGPQTLRLLPYGREPGDTQTVRVPAGSSVTLRIAIREDDGTPAEP